MLRRYFEPRRRASFGARNAWSVVASPNRPLSAWDNYLNGMSCTSPSQCVAVGEAGSTNPGTPISQTLVESWNGSTWSITPSPSSSPAGLAELQAVYCVNSVSCVAVGSNENSAAGWHRFQPDRDVEWERLVDHPPPRQHRWELFQRGDSRQFQCVSGCGLSGGSRPRLTVAKHHFLTDTPGSAPGVSFCRSPAPGSPILGRSRVCVQ